MLSPVHTKIELEQQFLTEFIQVASNFFKTKKTKNGRGIGTEPPTAFYYPLMTGVTAFRLTLHLCSLIVPTQLSTACACLFGLFGLRVQCVLELVHLVVGPFQLALQFAVALLVVPSAAATARRMLARRVSLALRTTTVTAAHRICTPVSCKAESESTPESVLEWQ